MALRGRLIRVAVAVAVPMLALAGCSKAALSKADFVAQADAICQATTAQVNKLPSLGTDATPDEVVKAVQQDLAIVQPAMARLTSLHSTSANQAVLKKNLIAPTQAADMATQTFISNVQEANGDADTEEAALAAFQSSPSDPDQSAENAALARFGFSACAQTDIAGNGPTTPPATLTPTTATPLPATPGTPAPFVATDAGFGAVFPTPPTRTVVIAGTINYAAATATEQVSVTYLSLPAIPSAADIRTALSTAATQEAADQQGTVISQRSLTYLGSPAIDAAIQAPARFVRIRVVVIGTGFYLLQGVTATTATPHPQYDELLATFHTI
jgi:hypothetical protein